VIDWGKQHPFYHRQGVEVGKVKWTRQELLYLGKTAKTILSKYNGVRPPRLFAEILAVIQSDKNAWPIFHEHHVLDSTRVRTGYKAYKQRLCGKEDEVV
jgi:hypothetical protein